MTVKISTQIASTFRGVLAGLEAERERVELRIVAVRTAAECFEDGSTNGQVKAHKRGFNGKGGPIFAVVSKRFRRREFGATDVAGVANIDPRHAMVWLGQKLKAGALTRVSRGVYRLSGGAK